MATNEKNDKVYDLGGVVHWENLYCPFIMSLSLYKVNINRIYYSIKEGHFVQE